MGYLRLDKYNPSIIHARDAVCEIEDAIVMSDNNQRPVLGKSGLPKNLYDQPAGVSVQGAGGFITNDQSWAVYQSPGNGYSLLLPS
jgi:hypothetical protein